MALENEVAALVTSTTALQGTVGAELAKVRAENTAFKTTVVTKPASAVNNCFAIFDGNSGADIKKNDRAFVNDFGAGSFDGVYVGIGDGFRHGSNLTVGTLSRLQSNTSGTNNTALGYFCLFSNTTGTDNVAIGPNSLTANTTGLCNIGVGTNSLRFNGSGNGNVAVGHFALYSSSGSNVSNCSGLGKNAEVTGSNQVQLGDSATTVYCYNSVQSRSDKRDKTDIRPTVLGLNFIKSLNPVDYRWDMREFYRPSAPQPLTEEATDSEKLAYELELSQWQEAVKFENLNPDGSKKKKRYHHGLIAQEVEALIKATGQDFGGFQDHKRSGGQDVLSIGYDELIAPLIKSVQELAQANEDLRARIAILEAGK